MARTYERDQNLKKLGPKSTSLKGFIGKKLRPLIDIDKIDTPDVYKNPFAPKKLSFTSEGLVASLANLKDLPEMGN